jgi:hypothetical protein
MGHLSTGKTIVHVQMGIMDMGDGQPPWIPGPEEIEEARERWQKALGEDYLVVATHFGEEVAFYDEVTGCPCG